jgi:hypothetical protein
MAKEKKNDPGYLSKTLYLKRASMPQGALLIQVPFRIEG